MSWVDMFLYGAVTLLVLDQVLKLRKRRPWIRWKKPEGEGVTFDGDTGAILRTFWNDDWKEQWKWILLEVPSRSEKLGCYMYFGSDGKWYRYFWKCRTHFVALQLGPGSVTFVAMHPGREGDFELPIKQVLKPTSRQSIERWQRRSGYGVTFI